MDSFVFDNVKADKAKAMRRYNRLRSLANAFRFLELLLASLFLAWAFGRVPFLVNINGEFILKLGGVVASPLFVFLVCNVIIVTLIAKSGIFSAFGNADSKIYDEITKIAENRSKSESQEEIVYQDKETISEPNTTTLTCEEMKPESESDSDTETDNPRVYRRSKSEKLPIRKTEEQVKKELRRSETEKCHKMENTDEELFPEDELSNEEFQRTIEDFIAKHLSAKTRME
ncbi:putative Phosphatidic acid phosphatase family protein [Hibiscus syriacus]|uniref:Phosphatidic acid phosphatase family protein n=1 Tax=Hibiscus syriacus TaxID=106335 RepID=A0A6A2Z3M2_HIBSY|nr:putative Phosphatidic acid phosphatase family protein [Hibiscus syriacus]